MTMTISVPTPHLGEDHFDKSAQTWDLDPRRLLQNQEIAQGIIEHVPFTPSSRMLDYGCGTGQLSFLLLPHVYEILAVDISAGMIERVREKVKQARGKGHPVRITPIVGDFTRDPLPDGKFDLIVTSTVIHHVKDPDRLFSVFGEILLPGGWLVVAEWFKKPGTYQEPVRFSANGYDPSELAARITKGIGRWNYRWKVVHFFQRDDEGLYPIFLLAGKRVQT